MQQRNCIRHSSIDQVKDYIKKLFDDQIAISVSVQKSRVRDESYNVTIQGVYPKFFTVHNGKLNANFTVQYIDVITGAITIKEIE